MNRLLVDFHTLAALQKFATEEEVRVSFKITFPKDIDEQNKLAVLEQFSAASDGGISFWYINFRQGHWVIQNG